MSSLSLTIMDSGHLAEFYPGLYSPVVDDGYHIQSNNSEGDFSLPSCGATDFPIHPGMTIDYAYIPPLDDGSYVQTPLYHPGSVSTNQRQHLGQQLYINTELQVYQPSGDSGSSTTSSDLLLQAPLSGYPSAAPTIRIPSPQSAPALSGTVMDFFENKPHIPPSPSSYNPSYIESGVFDFPFPPPIPSEVETQVPMPHVLEWKRVVEECGTKDFIPQTVYQPYTEADRKRYIREELQPTIFFHSDDPLELGISLDDALKQRLNNLIGKDELMFVNCGPSVSIRIQWPGYQPWSKQIPTKDFRSPKGPITRAKLAKNIATCIKHFVEAMQHKPMEAESNKGWKVGERFIKVEDLILVSLHYVSKGSWQPQLRLRRTLSHSSG